MISRGRGSQRGAAIASYGTIDSHEEAVDETRCRSKAAVEEADAEQGASRSEEAVEGSRVDKGTTRCEAVVEASRVDKGSTR